MQCLINPCDGAVCQRFLNAICIPNDCGECRATFFLPQELDEEITNCSTQTCDERTCPVRRICVEEEFPTSCPENKPNCRQYIRAACELPPKPGPPSDCSVVQCGPGMVCQVLDFRNGPTARCVKFRPMTCEQLGPCDSGMECRFRPRDEDHPIVRCVASRIRSKRPRDCSELDCGDSLTCMLFGAEGRQRARCVKERPRPRNCENLNCEAVGMICIEDSEGPKCRLPIKCDELKCPDSRVCAILGVPDIPLSFRCPFNEDNCKLLIMNRLEGDQILACLDPTLALQSCSEVTCPDNAVCAGKFIPEDSSMISVCIPKAQVSTVRQIATCESVPDDFCGENEACVDFQQDDYRGVAHCTQINCQDIECSTEEDTCLVSSSQLADAGISHSCAPVERVMLEQETTCTDGRTPCQGNTTCTDIRVSNLQISDTSCLRPFQLPPRSCGDLSCQDDEECVLDVTNGQVIRASCEQSAFIDQLLKALEAALDL